MKEIKLVSLIMALVMFTITGCSTVKGGQSGFLSDYSNFSESQRFPGMMVDNLNVAKVKDYNSFLVDPVVVYFRDPSKAEKIKPEVVADVTTYFHDQVVRALKDGGYTVVDQPGVGVMRIRLAVTDLVANKIWLNLHWATKLTKAGVGGACMEAEFIDALTGERIAAAIDPQMGRGWKMLKGLTAWGAAKDACYQWSEMLRKRMDELYKG